jgi:hypothetical protein
LNSSAQSSSNTVGRQNVELTPNTKFLSAALNGQTDDDVGPIASVVSRLAGKTGGGSKDDGSMSFQLPSAPTAAGPAGGNNAEGDDAEEKNLEAEAVEECEDTEATLGDEGCTDEVETDTVDIDTVNALANKFKGTNLEAALAGLVGWSSISLSKVKKSNKDNDTALMRSGIESLKAKRFKTWSEFKPKQRH